MHKTLFSLCLAIPNDPSTYDRYRETDYITVYEYTQPIELSS
jgi:hypothetical protein